MAVVKSESNVSTESSGSGATVDVDGRGSTGLGRGGTGGIAPGPRFGGVAVAVLALLRV